MCFTTEEIFKLLNKDQKNSIHLKTFPKIPANWKNNTISNDWNKIIKIRDLTNASIEIKRAEKLIGSSLEAEVKIKLNDELFNTVKKYDLSEVCITSKAEIILEKNPKEDISVETLKADGQKCNICWKISKNKCGRNHCPI